MLWIVVTFIAVAVGLVVYSLNSSAQSKSVKKPIQPKNINSNQNLAVRLYSTQHIVIATFLGSPVAGITLMILNYRAKKMYQKARDWIIIGIIASVFLLILIVFFGNHRLMKLFPFANLVIMVFVAKHYQEQLLVKHREEGGREYSGWKAAGIGVAFCATLLGIILLSVYIQNPFKHKIKFGTRDEIVYSSTVSEDNVRYFGKVLKKIGYFTDKGFTVGLMERNNTIIISFVVKQGSWNNSDIIDDFRKFGHALKQVTSKESNIEIRLCDDYFKTKRVIKDF